MADRPVVGIAGLGRMGSRVALKLLDAGFAVHVWNRSADPVRELESRGATPAPTPAELGAAVDVAITVLTNDEAVRHVALTDGLLQSLRRGSVFADLSTISPELAEELAREAEGLDGVETLDVQMSGSTQAVDTGQLVLLVGGSGEALDRVRVVLGPISKTIVHMGGHGDGARMKLAVNAILGTEMQALAEAIAFGQAVGLDRTRVLDALAQTAVVSPAHRAKLENARTDEYPPAFALSLMHKDFDLILGLAQHTGVELPATAASAAVCAEELERADRDEDFSAVVRRMEQHVHAARARG